MTNNIYYGLLLEVITKLNQAVRTVAQPLTQEQKNQILANIGALPATYTPPNQTAE